MSLPDLPAGVWRHWKGRDYLVLGLGQVQKDVGDPLALTGHRMPQAEC